MGEALVVDKTRADVDRLIVNEENFLDDRQSESSESLLVPLSGPSRVDMISFSGKKKWRWTELTAAELLFAMEDSTASRMIRESTSTFYLTGNGALVLGDSLHPIEAWLPLYVKSVKKPSD